MVVCGAGGEMATGASALVYRQRVRYYSVVTVETRYLSMSYNASYTAMSHGASATQTRKVVCEQPVACASTTQPHGTAAAVVSRLYRRVRASCAQHAQWWRCCRCVCGVSLPACSAAHATVTATQGATPAQPATRRCSPPRRRGELRQKRESRRPPAANACRTMSRTMPACCQCG